MNCSQARALLAVYKELNSIEYTELEAHLTTCDQCKSTQAQYRFMNDQVHALPQVTPSLEAQTRLMQALAAEHVRFIQRTSASATTTPTPTFLTPYVQDLARKSPRVHNLAAFSTAATGPLPALQFAQRRRRHRMTHFAIVGAAASVLMMLLVGSLTSLLLLAPHNNGGTVPSSGANIVQPSDVLAHTYPVKSSFAKVASAIGDGTDIYYTTYKDSGSSWQLEQFDEKKNISTPLLTSPSNQELFVLGSSTEWLVWLQIDPPKPHDGKQSVQPTTDASQPRAWSLKARSTSNMATSGTADGSLEIVSSSFDANSVPTWVNRPVQGIWLTHNTLLVALIDTKGVSHLVRYELDKTKGVSQPSEITTGAVGHILTSPTAASDTKTIYWADELFTNGQLSSNIWTQQTVNASPDNAGQWAAHPHTNMYAFRSDNQSFHPQIAGNLLFLLSTNPDTSNGNPEDKPIASPTTSPTQTPSATSSATATATPPTVTTTNIAGGATRIDPGIAQPQIDDVQSGHLLAFTLDGTEANLSLNSGKTVSSLQGSARFVIWQEDTKSFGMYDVVAKAPVSIGNGVVPQNASFLAVNDNTAVMATNSDGVENTSNNEQIPATVTFHTFTWPTPHN